MSNPLHSNYKVTLTDVSHIMGEMSKQAVTITDGATSFEETSKIYVTLGETGHLVTVQGPQAKREKGISAENLADIVETVVVAATNTGQFKKAQVSELDLMIKGMETLRDRMTISQGSMNPIKRFFFAAFGYTDKFDAALVKINNAINISKQQALVIKLDNLENKTLITRREILDIENELDRLSKEQIKNEDEKKQPKYEQEIVKIIASNKELELQEQQLSDKRALLLEATQPVREAEKKLMEAAEKFEIAKKAKGVKRIPLTGIWAGTNREGVKQGETAEKALQKAEKELKALKKTFEKSYGELNDLEKTLEKIRKARQENDEKRKKTNARLQPILNRQDDIQAQKKALAGKRQEIQSIQEEIKAKKTELGLLKNLQVETTEPVHIPLPKKTPANPALFQLPENASSVQRYSMEQIKAKLGFSRHAETTDAYVSYQRNVIFGFSMGQKESIEVLSKQANFELSDLKKMLEGGDATQNMFYVANQLETLLQKAKTAVPQDDKYIASLQKLQSDLEHSLPFAFRANAIASTGRFQNDPAQATQVLRTLSADITQELRNLKPGERLLIPTGTRNHATLLSLQKQDDGTVVPTFYNTGLGVEQQMTKGINLQAFAEQLATLTDKYPTSITYPPVDLNTASSQFESMMVELFQNTFSVTGSTEHMYESLEKTLGPGKAGDPKPVQLNGICSFQVLSEAFKDILGSKANYNTYKLELLSLVQEDFQQITNAMEHLVGENEMMQKLLALHHAMLKDNQRQLEATARVLEKESKRAA